MSAEPGTSGRPTPAQRVGTGLLIGLAVASVALVALDLVVPRHSRFGGEAWPGFYGLAGGAGCAAAILVALLLRRLARRPEDFYDR